MVKTSGSVCPGETTQACCKKGLGFRVEGFGYPKTPSIQVYGSYIFGYWGMVPTSGSLSLQIVPSYFELLESFG